MQPKQQGTDPAGEMTPSCAPLAVGRGSSRGWYGAGGGKHCLGPVFTSVCQTLVQKVIDLLAFASSFGAAAGLCSCVP